jgi:hypothetical protein
VLDNSPKRIYSNNNNNNENIDKNSAYRLKSGIKVKDTKLQKWKWSIKRQIYARLWKDHEEICEDNKANYKYKESLKWIKKRVTKLYSPRPCNAVRAALHSVQTGAENSVIQTERHHWICRKWKPTGCHCCTHTKKETRVATGQRKQ